MRQSRRGFFRTLAAVALGAPLVPAIAKTAVATQPTGIPIPFGTLPMNKYIRGPRYRVMFDRIVTPRYARCSGHG